MSHYDLLQPELKWLRFKLALAAITPTAVSAYVICQFVNSGLYRLFVAFAFFFISPLVLLAFRVFIPTCRRWSERADSINGEIGLLKKRMEAIFNKYSERTMGAHFKKAYALVGRSETDLEEALAIGMFRENKEVFVAVFMRNGVAVRVTASIGSERSCRSADNTDNWINHFEKLGCDELRFYHNHPEFSGSTAPSSVDIRTVGSLKAGLCQHRNKFRALIICWNTLREWRIFEYDETGQYSLYFEFDVSINQKKLLPHQCSVSTEFWGGDGYKRIIQTLV